LCGMEQARRSALAHHVHRTAPMGPRVLINGIWYKALGLDVPPRLSARADEVIEWRFLLRCIWSLLAQSGQTEPSALCPLSGVKRTSAAIARQLRFYEYTP